MSVDTSFMERSAMLKKTLEQLHEFKLLCHYEKETGELTWRYDHNGLFAGDQAGYSRKDGTRVIPVSGIEWGAAQVCWAMAHGEWPDGRVRFKNSNPSDLRLENMYVNGGAWRTREGRNAYNRAHRVKNPELYKSQDLKKDFGISAAEYAAMLDAQNGVCAICQRPETAIRNGKVKMLAVDHCHTHGHNRALLCVDCNLGIGRFHDSPERLRAAADYLEKHARKVVPLKKDTA